MLTISLARAEVAEALAALNSQHAGGWPVMSVIHLQARHLCGDDGVASGNGCEEGFLVCE